MFPRIPFIFVVLSVFLGVTGFANERGLSQSTQAKNLALLIGVSHGLPGIDLDVNNAEKIAKDQNAQFSSTRLMDSQATVSSVLSKTKELSAKVDANGTLFFYFSGHGGKGILLMQDTTVNITDIRKAIEAGRQNTGPLRRLVMMFDSCYAGSLLDALRRSGMPMDFNIDTSSETFMDDVMEAMKPSREGAYWKELFAFASSRADETSEAGQEGSNFTVALAKAYPEAMNGGTIGELVSKTKAYTQNHHPVERLVPLDLANEKMKQ
jgi:hypothetical protein